MRPSSSTRAIALGPLLAICGAAACGGSIEVGSDVLWTARFEGGTLDEWTGAPGGAVSVSSAPPGSAEVSRDHAHAGQFAAKLFIDAGSGGGQQYASLARKGELPAAAYYSAWYYLPQTVDVGAFWVIFKIRRRAVIDDPASEGELFDVDLVNDANGEMTLQLYDHRTDATVPLRADQLVVPVGVWFQIEAYYRNASDATGALTLWFNDQTVVDLEGIATSPAAWVEWDVVSVGENLTPSGASLFVDDCAVSRRRVGPGGRLAE